MSDERSIIPRSVKLALVVERDKLRWSFSRRCRRGYLTRRAWIRATLDRHLLRYETEHCEWCGGRVGLVYWCLSADTWAAVTGYDADGSRYGGGLLCPKCLDRGAQMAGDQVFWLAVHPDVFDEQVKSAIAGARP